MFFKKWGNSMSVIAVLLAVISATCIIMSFVSDLQVSNDNTEKKRHNSILYLIWGVFFIILTSSFIIVMKLDKIIDLLEKVT